MDKSDKTQQELIDFSDFSDFTDFSDNETHPEVKPANVKVILFVKIEI